MAPGFAVLSVRGSSKNEVVARRSLSSLLNDFEAGLAPPADKYLVVEYEESGHVPIARAEDAEMLERKARVKAGLY
jgi:hypothetical protein